MAMNILTSRRIALSFDVSRKYVSLESVLDAESTRSEGATVRGARGNVLCSRIPSRVRQQTCHSEEQLV